MRKYILRRLLIMVPVIFGISIVIFTLVHNMPGNPYSHMVNPNLSIEDRENMLRAVGYYDPLPVKYVRWVGRAVRGDLGYSIRYKEPVLSVIRPRMGNTLLLALTSFVLSTLIAIPLGVISASKQYSMFDYTATVLAFIGLSIPAFFFGMLLIKFVAFDLGWFPIAGMRSMGTGFTGLRHIFDVIHHMIQPVLVLTLVNTASLMRYTRSSMLENIKQDYVRTARAKGLPENRVIYSHALRNALIPVITILTLSLPYLFSGAILTETVFVWPGIGTLAFHAILNRDYPLIMGNTMIIAVVVLLSNLLADVLYAVVDPRIRYD